jgi:hypothetical protein
MAGAPVALWQGSVIEIQLGDDQEFLVVRTVTLGVCPHSPGKGVSKSDFLFTKITFYS